MYVFTRFSPKSQVLNFNEEVKKAIPFLKLFSTVETFLLPGLGIIF